MEEKKDGSHAEERQSGKACSDTTPKHFDILFMHFERIKVTFVLFFYFILFLLMLSLLLIVILLFVLHRLVQCITTKHKNQKQSQCIKQEKEWGMYSRPQNHTFDNNYFNYNQFRFNLVSMVSSKSILLDGVVCSLCHSFSISCFSFTIIFFFANDRKSCDKYTLKMCWCIYDWRTNRTARKEQKLKLIVWYARLQVFKDQRDNRLFFVLIFSLWVLCVFAVLFHFSFVSRIF